VDRVDLLHAKLADLLAPEKLASAGTARSPWAAGPTSTGAATTGTIPRGAIGTISCWAVWTVSRRTIAGRPLCCRAFGRAWCCCCCAGLFSHGFLLLSSRPAF
jgi:hypothetical protein